MGMKILNLIRICTRFLFINTLVILFLHEHSTDPYQCPHDYLALTLFMFVVSAETMDVLIDFWGPFEESVTTHMVGTLVNIMSFVFGLYRMKKNSQQGVSASFGGEIRRIGEIVFVEWAVTKRQIEDIRGICAPRFEFLMMANVEQYMSDHLVGEAGDKMKYPAVITNFKGDHVEIKFLKYPGENGRGPTRLEADCERLKEFNEDPDAPQQRRRSRLRNTVTGFSKLTSASSTRDALSKTLPELAEEYENFKYDPTLFTSVFCDDSFWDDVFPAEGRCTRRASDIEHHLVGSVVTHEHRGYIVESGPVPADNYQYLLDARLHLMGTKFAVSTASPSSQPSDHPRRKMAISETMKAHVWEIKKSSVQINFTFMFRVIVVYTIVGIIMMLIGVLVDDSWYNATLFLVFTLFTGAIVIMAVRMIIFSRNKSCVEELKKHQGTVFKLFQSNRGTGLFYFFFFVVGGCAMMIIKGSNI